MFQSILIHWHSDAVYQIVKDDGIWTVQMESGREWNATGAGLAIIHLTSRIAAKNKEMEQYVNERACKFMIWCEWGKSDFFNEFSAHPLHYFSCNFSFRFTAVNDKALQQYGLADS